jgi:hypothetical protein
MFHRRYLGGIQPNSGIEICEDGGNAKVSTIAKSAPNILMLEFVLPEFLITSSEIVPVRLVEWTEASTTLADTGQYIFFVSG